jgi:hypothetical protein
MHRTSQQRQQTSVASIGGGELRVVFGWREMLRLDLTIEERLTYAIFIKDVDVSPSLDER